jgi:hypothetical protein
MRKKHHLNVDVKKRGFTFAKCIVCESLKDLKSKVGKNSASGKEVQMKLKKITNIKNLAKHSIEVGK